MTEKLHGRLMLDLAATSLADDEPTLLQNPHVGGVILFARNVESRQQIAALVAEIRAVTSSIDCSGSGGRSGTEISRGF